MAEKIVEIIKLKLQPTEGSLLYRYLTIDKLIDMLVNERIPLTRLSLFEDKLEGTTTQHLLLNVVSDQIAEAEQQKSSGLLGRITYNVNSKRRNEHFQNRKKFQEFNYASCWFVSDHESIAMWQLYSRKDSVAIKIPYGNFVQEIENKKFELSSDNYINLSYGNINYFKFNDFHSLTDEIFKQDEPGFVKDKSFAHEQEFRIILSTIIKEQEKLISKEFILDEQIEKLNDERDLKIIYVKLFSFKKMPFEIIFHPQSTSWHRENVISLLNNYNLNFQVHESALNKIFK